MKVYPVLSKWEFHDVEGLDLSHAEVVKVFDTEEAARDYIKNIDILEAVDTIKYPVWDMVYDEEYNVLELVAGDLGNVYIQFYHESKMIES